MARAQPFVAPEDRRPGQRQIAQRVQHLVAHRFVGVAQPFGVQHRIAIDHDRIGQRTAAGQAAGAHGVNVALAAEGAAVAQLAHKGAVGHVQGLLLPADGGVGEFDLERDLELVAGHQPGDGIAVAHLDRGEDAQGAHRGRQFAHAARQDRVHKGGGAAVQDRDFRPVDVDQRVLNTAAGQRRGHVFDGRDADPVAVLDHRAQPRRRHRSPMRRHHRVAPGRVGQIGAAEPDAVFGRGRADGHRDRRTRMQAHAPECDR